MNFKDLITPFDIMVIASGIDHHSGCKLSELIDFIDSDSLYVGFKHSCFIQGVGWEYGRPHPICTMRARLYYGVMYYDIRDRVTADLYGYELFISTTLYQVAKARSR